VEASVTRRVMRSVHSNVLTDLAEETCVFTYELTLQNPEIHSTLYTAAHPNKTYSTIRGGKTVIQQK
jgi:hypothetical protein